MKRTKKDKKLVKTKKTVNSTVSEEKDENVVQLDTAISAKSSSLIVSSLYLFSLAVIILALAVVIGLASYIHSYNFEERSTDRFDYYTEDYKEQIHFPEDTVVQENSDGDLDDVVQPYVSEQYDLQKQNSDAEMEEKGSDVKSFLNLEHRDLFKSYTYDYEKALKLREEAMKKYSYPHSTDGVDKRSNLSLQEFYDVYDGKWPVIVTDVIPSWPAFNWSTTTLKGKYGEARVGMMAYNIRGEPGHKGDREGYSVPLGIFIDHLGASSYNSWTYVQDEVFLVQFPELRAQVLDTIYTKEDFFNHFPKDIRPWDCLLLWGTSHSRSTLHIDPYNWTGTNAVISGHKKWKLIPPGQDRLLSVKPDATCGFPLACQKYNSKYDTYSMSDQIARKLKKIKYLEVDQMSGEMLFLPTGWFHQAFNVVPTLAVSGELMNRNNYLAVLEEIFHVNNVPRSILPHDVEKMSPEELVQFVMSKMPASILDRGAEWTKMNINNLYGVPAEQTEL